MSVFRWTRGERLVPPPEDMPPRPQQPRESRARDEIPEEVRRAMSGPTRPEFDPCGAGPIQIRERS